MSGFSDLKDKLQELYNSKSDSEQKLLLVLGVVLPVFFVYSLYSSVSTGLMESQDKLRKQRELNTWAQTQIETIQGANAGDGSTNRDASMTQVINNSARKFNVSIARLQPQKTDMVKVGIDEIGFNTLMKWLAELETRHGISASNIDVSKADASGMVKVRRLDLERK